LLRCRHVIRGLDRLPNPLPGHELTQFLQFVYLHDFVFHSDLQNCVHVYVCLAAGRPIQRCGREHRCRQYFVVCGDILFVADDVLLCGSRYVIQMLSGVQGHVRRFKQFKVELYESLRVRLSQRCQCLN
jgi:hypothetical protein